MEGTDIVINPGYIYSSLSKTIRTDSLTNSFVVICYIAVDGGMEVIDVLNTTSFINSSQRILIHSLTTIDLIFDNTVNNGICGLRHWRLVGNLLKPFPSYIIFGDELYTRVLTFKHPRETDHTLNT